MNAILKARQKLGWAEEKRKLIFDWDTPLNLNLKIDGRTLSFVHGTWQFTDDENSGFQVDIENLQRQNKLTSDENRHFQEKYKEAREQKYLAEFKHKLMLEMMAVQKLDSESLHLELAKEKLKVD